MGNQNIFWLRPDPEPHALSQSKQLYQSPYLKTSCALRVEALSYHCPSSEQYPPALTSLAVKIASATMVKTWVAIFQNEFGGGALDYLTSSFPTLLGVELALTYTSPYTRTPVAWVGGSRGLWNSKEDRA